MKTRITSFALFVTLPILIGVSLASAQDTLDGLLVRTIAPNESLPVRVDFINLETLSEQVEVTLDYQITSLETGTVIVRQSENIFVIADTSFIKNLSLPPDSPKGSYSVDVNVTHDNQVYVAISQAIFDIESKWWGFYTSQWISAMPYGLMLMFIFFILLFIFHKWRESRFDRKQNSDKTVLLVEADLSVAKVLREKLVAEKFRVVVAHDNQSGIHKAQDTKPDLIVVDLFEPQDKDHLFLQQLRKDAWGNKSIVILLTNTEQIDERVQQYVVDKYRPKLFLAKSETKTKHLIKHIYELLK